MNVLESFVQAVPNAGPQAKAQVGNAQQRLDLLRARGFKEEADIFAQGLINKIQSKNFSTMDRDFEEIAKLYGSNIKGEGATRPKDTTAEDTAKKEALTAATIAELNQLANGYRNVADMAAQAATAERSAATARVTALYMNNRAVRDQAQAMSELGSAVRSGIAGTPLMLPAAGQTTAPGSGLQFSGDAIPGLPSANIQKVLTPGAFPGELQQGPEISPEQADAARRAYLSTAEAARVKAEAEQMAAESSMRLRAEVDKARQANDGSINSIQRYRDSLVTLRNTLPATGSEFRKFKNGSIVRLVK